MACSVEIAVEVPFTKKTLLKGRIEQGALDESHETYEAWMKQVLLLANHASRNLFSKTDGLRPKQHLARLAPGR